MGTRAAPVSFRLLRKGEGRILSRLAPGVFDGPVDDAAARRYLADPRLHLVVALDGDLVVGMASGVHYFHPDKPAPEMFVNEVGVAPSHRRRGVGRRVLAGLLDHARSLGCLGAWVLTDPGNRAALGLHGGLGGAPGSGNQVLLSFDLRDPAAPSPTARARGGRSPRRGSPSRGRGPAPRRG